MKKVRSMNNIKTFVQHIKEAAKVYTGYRSGEYGENVELEEEPILVYPYKKEKDLSSTNLRRHFFRSAQLDGFDLSGADLTYADLTDANFTDANLSGAILKNADLKFTDFTNANLSDVKGLETCNNVESARFYGANLTGVSEEFFDLLHEKEQRNTENYEEGWRGLVTWQYDGPIPNDEVSLQEFLKGCKGIPEKIKKKWRGKEMFGL